MNREDGQVERVITTYEQYIEMYKYICQMNDVAMAIKVFSDFSGKTKRELLYDFNLVELINCFSTRYLAKSQPLPKKGKTLEYKNKYGNITFKLEV